MFSELGIYSGWGYGRVFRTRYALRIKIRKRFSNGVYVSVGDTAMFSPSKGGVCGAYSIRPYTCYTSYIEIRTCFSNWEYISVRDTDMFSPPMGGVCGAYSIRPYTCYMPYIKIRKRFPNRIHVIHRNTNTFSKSDIRYPSKYGNVFRTGHTLSIEIRPCFPN